MSYQNIFTGGAGEAKSAEQSARKLQENIPGAWPEQKGVDPELYDDIPDEPRDPKIVKERSPEAINIMENFLIPQFQKLQTIAADQRKVSENPGSVSNMASSVQEEISKKMKARISDEDKPRMPEPSNPGIPPKLEKQEYPE